MRTVFDLFPLQTPSKDRGIGRYTRALLDEMIRQADGDELFLLAYPYYKENAEELRQRYIRCGDNVRYLPYSSSPVWREGKYAAQEIAIAKNLGQFAHLTLQPDYVVIPSLFEGWQQPGVTAYPPQTPVPYRNAVICYDLIPHLFQDKFLEKNKPYQEWYLDRIRQYQRFDTIFAISESTKNDLVTSLKIDAGKIVNISSAIDPMFAPQHYSDYEKTRVLQQFGVTKPFIFCLGNVEYHKNVDSLVEAYATLPAEIRRKYQLVLTKINDNKVDFLTTKYPHLQADMVVLGQITDTELLALYNLCTVFVLPSRYEGFGLPALEAMACGTAVLAGNNSSIPEVTGRTDNLFDSNSIPSIQERLTRALTDEIWRNDLKRYGLLRATHFSWQQTAAKVWETLRRSSPAGSSSVTASPQNKPLEKVAFVSPLPPQASGIADYSADLLPHLGKHFDLDLFVEPADTAVPASLTRSFEVLPAASLIQKQKDYATVVYQFGNSNFHVHMVRLLQEFPGVVVLHDFFLSNLGYVEEVWNQIPHRLRDQADSSHGIRGAISVVRDGMDLSREKWPMNWDIIESASAVVVHSEFARQLLLRFSHQRWQPKLHVIPQIRTIPPEVNSNERQLARQKIGAQDDEFLITSFGYVSDTKMSLEVISAFENMEQGDSKTKLVLVGELAGSEYGKKITQALDSSPVKNQITVTGFVSPELYQTYLAASDLAIQLRTTSRGETSRAVLDCLAYGVPVVINSDGTLADYPDEIVVRLADPPSVEHLTETLKLWTMDKAICHEKGAKGREWFIEHHSPERIASLYAAVIQQSIDTDERRFLAPSFRAIKTADLQQERILDAARHAADIRNLRRAGHRLLVDVTDIAVKDWNGGIQRVVKSICTQLLKDQFRTVEVEVVRLVDGELRRAARFTENLCQLPTNSLGDERKLKIFPGDNFLMMDAPWNQYPQFLPTFAEIRSKGGKITTVLHDLIPVNFPEVCHQVVLDVFEDWLHLAIQESDHFITVSRAVMDDLNTYLTKTFSHTNHRINVDHFHLGADIPADPTDTSVRQELVDFVNRNKVFFLMVGTLEPRKGHALALEAMTRVWEEGNDVGLLFLGRPGWNIDGLLRQMAYLNREEPRFHHFENVTDGEISFGYRYATGLLALSLSEGFGLPVVEAAMRGVPVIASDIPVFKEKCGEGTLFVDQNQPDQIARAILRMSKYTEAERAAACRGVKVITWDESAKLLLERIHSFSN